MKGSIRAKPTVYQGVEFRSRLEARWAVFFDACGIAWNYEPRWIELDEGPYLPDFILPELRIVVEVKPKFQEEAICRLWHAVEVLDNFGESPFQECYFGLLLTQDDISVPNLHSGNQGPWVAFGPKARAGKIYQTEAWWCECHCGQVSIGHKGKPYHLFSGHCAKDDSTSEATPRLRAAYQKATRAFTRSTK